MRREWTRSAVVVLVLILVSALGAGGAASGQLDTPALAVGLPPAAGLSPEPWRGMISPRVGGPVTVFVELTQAPAVDVFSAARASGSPVAVAAAAAR
ncbi:MAG TPA: hypothetical protein VFO16_16855, partial [Pseudonocardiaceae bacterium]|nr:hypothetical protein [Pseudonocardiaceae bacterium]